MYDCARRLRTSLAVTRTTESCLPYRRRLLVQTLATPMVRLCEVPKAFVQGLLDDERRRSGGMRRGENDVFEDLVEALAMSWLLRQKATTPLMANSAGSPCPLSQACDGVGTISQKRCCAQLRFSLLSAGGNGINLSALRGEALKEQTMPTGGLAAFTIVPDMVGDMHPPTRLNSLRRDLC